MTDRKMVNMTITVSKEEKKALRQAAVDLDLSVSGVIRMWLEEYQYKKEGKDSGDNKE